MTAIAAALIMIMYGLGAPGSAEARMASPNAPFAVVSMGDSFISGEAGRWAGNANTRQYGGGNAWDTDRGVKTYTVDNKDTSAGTGNGCHRSTSAEITGVQLWQTKTINLACSGATTDDLLTNTFKGEEPQIDQLDEVAQNNDVKLIVVSIGGNDIGFSDIIKACTVYFLAPRNPLTKDCPETHQAALDNSLGTLGYKVGNVLDKIRSTMAERGYTSTEYRLVLQSYPNPIALPEDNRYPDGSGGPSHDRYAKGGCPFTDTASRWAAKTILPGITTVLRKAAADHGAVFFDLSQAAEGHELCSKRVRQSTGPEGVPFHDAEWIRWIPYATSLPGSQGEQQEAIHPNFYGQQALGDCLNQLVRKLDAKFTDWGFGCGTLTIGGKTMMSLYPLPDSTVGEPVEPRPFDLASRITIRTAANTDRPYLSTPATGAGTNVPAELQARRASPDGDTTLTHPGQAWWLERGRTNGWLLMSSTGQALDVEGNRAYLRQRGHWADPFQNWQFHSAGLGAYWLVNVKNHTCLTMPTGQDPVPIVEQCVGSDRQRWLLDAAFHPDQPRAGFPPSPEFAILDRAGSRTLTATSQTPVLRELSGELAFPQNQERWMIDASGRATGVHLVHKATGQCLTDPGSSANVLLEPCRYGDAAQSWSYNNRQIRPSRWAVLAPASQENQAPVKASTSPQDLLGSTFQIFGLDARPVKNPIPDSAVKGAYSFLHRAQDKWATPGEISVPPSYEGGYFSDRRFGPDGYESSFTYDNAVMISAYLHRDIGDDRRYATRLGEALLYAQENDSNPDGRIRASYLPRPFITRTGQPYVGGFAVYTGHMAWAGMAFARLYHVTGEDRFLQGALKAANWIVTNTTADDSLGGYRGGYRNGDESGANMIRILWKSTEHNIDVGAFFAMLSTLTGNKMWTLYSEKAFSFVRRMQDADGRLWTGTTDDGQTLNTSFVPGDIQVWSYLATLDPRYARSMDWAAKNLTATHGPFTGLSFSNVDTSKVWFEGTAHLIAAYHQRNAPDDEYRAGLLQATLLTAQQSAPNADGQAIVAASGDGLGVDGGGDFYYASRHTGATAWFLLAALHGNPFRL
ncbi:SGNH/GDSL hydrolase family protein [Streptosporangium sp. NPDC049376]|uniref:SGNH/GDSL hydrolase family protein n=1 Tax=Streptosporangium sp. NPDC049376 TaxID=3366192 RepID=UPI0037A86489